MTWRILVLLLFLVGSAQARYGYDHGVRNEDYNTQALLGIVQFDHLKFTIEDSQSPNEVDFSTLPQLGGAWMTLPYGNRLQTGLEASLLVGFRIDELNYLRAGGSGLEVDFSIRMWMFDLAGGGYLNFFIDTDRRARIYAGAGPLIVYADYRIDREYSDHSPDDSEHTSAWGVGFYARTGFEIRTHDEGLFGLGLRGSWMDIDFTGIGGHSELTGLAAFMTYTVGF